MSSFKNFGLCHVTAVCMLTSASTLLCAGIATAQTPLTSEFTYQGQLSDNNVPVSDSTDFEFTLWDSESQGNLVDSTVSLNNVSVVNGLFTVKLDFGSLAFNGDARWLEISLRNPSGSGPFITLVPRQQLTSAPYAITAMEAVNAWNRGGNAGNEPTNFIGTTDNQPVEFRANNERLLRLEHGDATVFGQNVGGNIIGGAENNSVVSGNGSAVLSGGSDVSGNVIYGDLSVIAGGMGNRIGSDADKAVISTIAGGAGNVATSGSFVGGGSSNEALGGDSVIKVARPIR